MTKYKLDHEEVEVAKGQLNIDDVGDLPFEIKVEELDNEDSLPE